MLDQDLFVRLSHRNAAENAITLRSTRCRREAHCGDVAALGKSGSTPAMAMRLSALDALHDNVPLNEEDLRIGYWLRVACRFCRLDELDHAVTEGRQQR